MPRQQAPGRTSCFRMPATGAVARFPREIARVCQSWLLPVQGYDHPCFQRLYSPATTPSRLSRPGFCNDPKAVWVAAELGNFEILAQFRKPPGRRFLDKVSIAAVAKNLLRWACCYGEEAHFLGD